MQHPTTDRLRALGTSSPFWLAMFAASAFGTNLGDLWTGRLGMPEELAFGLLVVVSAGAILVDRMIGPRREWAYWLAIVVLRAAATNVADLFTERMHLSSLALIVGTTVLALVAGLRTRPGPTGTRGASPVVDAWYWTAMFVAGVFGTVAGDEMNGTVGVGMSAAVLTAVLVIVLVGRSRLVPAAMLSYWVAVLAERTAGTPIGDGLASRRGAGLGLGLATACTAGLFALALLWREYVRRRGAWNDGTRPGRTATG